MFDLGDGGTLLDSPANAVAKAAAVRQLKMEPGHRHSKTHMLLLKANRLTRSAQRDAEHSANKTVGLSRGFDSLVWMFRVELLLCHHA